jgi:predicted sulfurtransferase
VPDTEYCVLNFYHLVDLPDVHSEIEAHRLFILGEEAIAYAASGSVANSAAAPRPLREVRGRIYLSKQGINCQAGGKTQDCVEYARWVASRPDFQGLRYTLWPYPHGHAHPRLRLKHRPSLISLAGGMEALPITDPSQRATPLEPDAWARMLATAQDVSFCFLGG